MLTAAIIAGGSAQRLGGQDKLLVEIGGQRQIDRLLRALRRQTDRQIVVSNRDPSAYSSIAGPEIPVIRDLVPGAGPLAGIHAALAHCQHGDVLCVPADLNWVPDDLHNRLAAARDAAAVPVACVHDGAGLQPLCCLLPASLQHSAKLALDAGQLALHAWLKAAGLATADFAAWPRWAWSFNTPEELAQVRAQLAGLPP